MKRQVSILIIGQTEEYTFFKNEKVEHSDETSEIVALRDGGTAISYLNKEGNFGDRKIPELIIINFNLPGNSGIELLKYIKNTPKLKPIPLVIISLPGLNKK